MKHNSGRFKKGERRSPCTEFQKGCHWRPHAVFREKDYLQEQYTNRKRTAEDIAKEHGATAAAVLFWLKKHQIRRRTTSEIRKEKQWSSPGKQNGMYGRIGDKNPNWKGGCTPDRQLFYVTLEWKRVARFVKKRDKRTCQRCGAPGNHIHHIVSFSVVELRAVATNLVLLCESCHDFIHSNANKNREFIREASGRV